MDDPMELLLCKQTLTPSDTYFDFLPIFPLDKIRAANDVFFRRCIFSYLLELDCCFPVHLEFRIIFFVAFPFVPKDSRRYPFLFNCNISRQ